MKNFFKFTLFLIVILLTGCLKSNDNHIVDSNIQEDSYQKEAILSILPDRESIKSSILSDLHIGANSSVKRSINKVSMTEDYYFALSKEKVEIFGTDGTVEIQFIYIENYNSGDTSEIEYTGNISYIYQNTLIDDMYEWVLMSSQVTFTEVETGSISGSVSFLNQPLEDISVYAKSGEEYSKIVKTDSLGSFLINDVLINTYDIVVYGENFPETVVPSITVEYNNTTVMDTTEILPYETNEYAGIYGFVYFDELGTEKVSGANVYLKNPDGSDTEIKPCFTDVNGYFVISGIQEGTYEVFAKILNNVNSNIINITQSNYGSVNKIENLILTNSKPYITSITPEISEEAEYFEIGEKKRFIVEATDDDGDQLFYDWSTTGGNLSINNNICEYEATNHGEYELKVIIKDNKGGETQQVWNIEAGWVEMKGAAQFPGRYAYSSVILDDGNGKKIFVLGGNSGYVRDEVIYSVDGINWITIGNMPWGARQRMESIIFNNGTGEKIWMFCGIDASGNKLHDAWSSVDGLNWVQETTEVNFNASSYFKLEKFDDGTGEKLYAIGGSDENGQLAEVWRSSNGINWELLTDNAGFGVRSGHETFVYDNKIWLISGASGAYTKDDIWYTENGIEWFCVSAHTSGLYRSDFALGHKDGKFIITGGHPNYQYTVYESDDAVNWNEIPNTPFQGRTAVDIQYFNGDFLMISGYCKYIYSGQKEIWKIKFND